MCVSGGLVVVKGEGLRRETERVKGRGRRDWRRRCMSLHREEHIHSMW